MIIFVDNNENLKNIIETQLFLFGFKILLFRGAQKHSLCSTVPFSCIYLFDSYPDVHLKVLFLCSVFESVRCYNVKCKNFMYHFSGFVFKAASNNGCKVYPLTCKTYHKKMNSIKYICFNYTAKWMCIITF